MATYESCEGMNSSQSTSSAEVFPASRTLSPGSEEPPTMTATSGPKCSESFAQLSPDGCWLKMYQGCFHPRLDGSLEAFSETWPRAGILSGGTAYQRQPLARRIAERESSSSESWRTPDAHCARGSYTSENMPRRIDRGMPLKLNDQIMHPEMWPTPVANDDNKSPEAHMAMKARMKGGPRNTITSLNVMVKAQQLWPTPRAGNPGSRKPGTGGAVLGEMVKLWPTPAAQDSKNATLPPSQAARDTLPGAMVREKQWPTPKASDSIMGMTANCSDRPPEKSTHIQAQVAIAEGWKPGGGQLNPDWVECLMGFPQGWTRLDASGPQDQGKSSTTGSRRE